MRLARVLVCVVLAVGASSARARQGQRIVLPPDGRLYHGVYPGGYDGDEDDITAAQVRNYEGLVGQQVAWVYFSHNWFQGRRFPLATATWIRDLGSVPFIRLMLRSEAEMDVRERVYTLQRIIDGDFDADLRRWARDASAFGTAIVVEYGTECNGNWFQWNAQWHGKDNRTGFGDPDKFDGAERFVAAYRHIVQTMRAEGADNIRWCFHVDSEDYPERNWNRMELYYPGDDVVDWLGVSCYGAQTPIDDWPADAFRLLLDLAYPRLRAVAPSKPIMVMEFGCTAGRTDVEPGAWARAALTDLFAGRWPEVRGFSWWNEAWENDDNPAHDTTMRVEDIPSLATAFTETLAANVNKLQTRPVFEDDGDGGDDEPGGPPVADAGPDQTVRLGETVTLDGSGSYHPDDAVDLALWSNGATVTGTNGTNWAALIDGNSTQYSGWTGFAYTFWRTSPPGSMTVTLPQAVRLTKLRVKLWDGDSRYYRYTVDIAESAAGPWQRVVNRTSGVHQGWCEDTFVPAQARYIRITGTYNSANNGFHVVELEAFGARPLTYAWSQTAGPDVSLSDPTAAAPTFTPPQTGQYEFELRVSDGAQTSPADTVAVTVTPAPAPVADAGPDQTVRLGETVTMDGSGSYHPDDLANVALAASGATVTGTNGTNWAALIDGNSTQYTGASGFGYTYWRTSSPGAMTVTLAQAVRLTKLRVKLWDGDSRYYRYTVDVAESAAGPWQRVVNRTSGVHQGWCEDSFAPVSARHIRITGTYSSANAGFHVVELEAYAARPLTYAWSQTAGPDVSLSDPTAAGPTFTPPQAGQYEFELRVSDGVQTSPADTVAIAVTPAPAPVADAGPDQTVSLGETVALDGSGSHHPDDQTTNIALAANGAAVTGTNGAAWAALIDGNSTQYTGASGYGYTYWTTSPPGTMTVTLAQAARLTKLRVKLWDGDNRYYRYTIDVAQSAAGPWQRVVDRRSGTHRGWCEDTFAPVQASYVRITGTYNSANAGFHVVELEAFGARPLTYAWSQTAGPDVSLSDPTAATPTFTPPQTGQFDFELRVSDGAQTSTADAVAITATAAPPPVADAGPDQTVTEGQTATLDGSGSYHPDDAGNVALATKGATVTGTNGTNWAALIDGNSTQYTGATGFGYTYWRTSPPGSMTVTLAQTARLTKLRVKLWDADSRYYRYTVDVAQSAAGPWQRVVDRTSGAHQGWCEDTFAEVRASYVRITGTYNSANNGFHVVELQAYEARPLTYAWTQASGSTVTLSDPTAARPTFTPSQPGECEFDLVVSDAVQSSSADRVAITVTRGPAPDRPDGAQRLDIPLAGSLQNPAFSPDGRTILFTRFRNGYNTGPADLYLFNLDTGVVLPLVADGNLNVNLPGAAWHPATNRIAFASDRDPHDEIFTIPATGHTGDETRVTSRATRQSYEPAFSPDGQWLVFESHPIDVPGSGVITKFRADGTGAYGPLTADGDDCRQPNWDPAGTYVVYQKLAGGQWDLWLTDPAGATHRKLTTGTGDKTDASFSPSGTWVVYSSDEGGLARANLFARPADGGDARRITQYTGYDGAPSWSPDGTRVAFESTPGDPDGSAGATLWIINASEDLAPPLSAVQFWAYQIQNVEDPGSVDALAASKYDLLVIEPTRTDWSSAEARNFDTRAAVARLKATSGHDGTRRKLVLAYVDIGEAEDWRWYWTWSTTWQPGRPRPADWPDYIVTHDPDGWEGNYPVAYWDPAWKDLMIYGRNYPPTSSRDFTSVLDEALRDGFDGIYLDWVEAWEDPNVQQAAAADGVDSAQEMIDFIAEIRTYARQRNPNFLVVQQNSSELIDGRPQLLAHIDAIAQEAVWYDGVGGNDDWSDPDGYDYRNDSGLTNYYKQWLAVYKAAGLPVFNCEYARTRAADAYTRSLNNGYIPYCTRRSLGALTTTPPPGY